MRVYRVVLVHPLSSCVPELRPASTVPIVALVVALIGTLTCLVLVLVNYRRTRKVLASLQEQDRLSGDGNSSGERVAAAGAGVAQQDAEQVCASLTAQD